MIILGPRHLFTVDHIDAVSIFGHPAESEIISWITTYSLSTQMRRRQRLASGLMSGSLTRDYFNWNQRRTSRDFFRYVCPLNDYYGRGIIVSQRPRRRQSWWRQRTELAKPDIIAGSGDKLRTIIDKFYATSVVLATGLWQQIGALLDVN